MEHNRDNSYLRVQLEVQLGVQLRLLLWLF